MSNELLARPLILGAHGQLGTDLVTLFSDCSPIGLDQSDVDLEDADAVAAMFEKWKPSIVINSAAYTNVDACEKNPDRAFGVNATAVDRLAQHCDALGIGFATISTDFVFSGSGDRPYDEHDEPQPINTYGVSKLAGELLTRRHGSRWFIFRTSGLYGLAASRTKGYTFVERVFDFAKGGDPVRVVDDVVSSPSYTIHVGQAMRRVVESGRFGLYHLTNAGSCSWYEFAREAFALAGLSAEIQAVKQADFTTFAPRPRYTALARGELARSGLADLPDWRVGLRDYLDARKHA
jgi:dTDP-4-dehydrorhamnose reductase